MADELFTLVQGSGTIVSLSSGLLPSGIAVVRLSGPDVCAVLATMLGSVPVARQARYGAIRDANGAILDRGISLFFPAPASFTGEDCAEFQIHGGPAVVSALLRHVVSFAGCRLAEAGEFTRRAFLNGKLDLLSAEATADIISAETEAQRRFAILNAEGRHVSLYDGWRSRLVHARAMLEAELDFSDEADVAGLQQEAVWQDLAALRTELYLHVEGFGRAEILKGGYRVVLAGAPNAGKSSLLNALAGRDVAIVTDEPGTTRDPVEVVLDLDGIKVRLIDTAGIREAAAKAERLGIERSVDLAANADLVLWLEDLQAAHHPAEEPLGGTARLRVGTKLDLWRGHGAPTGYHHCLSAISGAGIDELLGDLVRRVSLVLPGAGELLPWRQRHVDLLFETAAYINKSLEGDAQHLELRCEDLRGALAAIGRITGKVDVEDLLDVIFSQFCIGK